jgi:two-component system LytT family sensor kinase
MRLRRRHWLFTLNLAGWAIFGAVVSALFPSPGVSRGMRTALIMFLGAVTTAALRWFYIAAKTARKPVAVQVLTVCAASTAGALVWWAVELLVLQTFLHAPHRPGWIFAGFATSIVFDGLPLLGWSFLYFAMEYWLSWSDQEERLARALALAQAAQLQMLRYQLNPHFLFNALNSIRALIDEDAAKACEMITELSGFLRYSLDNDNCLDVPLWVELEALGHYFAIQKKRYEDKLEVSFEVDPGAREARVLSFLVHPLVENAVKFGMGTSPMPLRIRISARAVTEALILTVSNTGRWVRHSGNGAGTAGTSTGIENVKRRLENAYPGRHTFQSFERDGWVHVKLQVPVLPGGVP